MYVWVGSHFYGKFWKFCDYISKFLITIMVDNLPFSFFQLNKYFLNIYHVSATEHGWWYLDEQSSAYPVAFKVTDG